MIKEAAFLNTYGLYNKEFEHDACGVGFVANIKGKKSHSIIRDGIKMLEKLEHRGATGSDSETGDGAGILIQIPDLFIRKECERIELELPEFGDYGIGLLFLPHQIEDRHTIESIIENVVYEEGQNFIGLRDVPFDDSQIGRVAKSEMPFFKQVIIGRNSYTNREDFERKLLIIRKKTGIKIRNAELTHKNMFYICSLSSKVLIYKGQLKSSQLDKFFLDLNSSSMASAIALVHSRYSTNTFPTWALAHPFRMIAHNGEINTLRGNVNWFNAREKMFSSDLFGNDLSKISPIIAPSKSDSAAFDNALEALVAAGRSIPHAIMMMIPEAFDGDKNMEPEKKDFYKYQSCLMEPWDGPATISFTDGRYVGAVLDRNGLRPSRYYITDDDRVVLASEAGALAVPEKNIISKGRIQPGKIFLVDTAEGRIIEDAEIKNKIIHNNPYSKWIKENLITLEDIEDPGETEHISESRIMELQRAFGYTEEDVNLIISPMALHGTEALGSMGADTPLAVLSKKPQLLFNYFHQLFAQVTNPPIDAIREEIVMSQTVMLGAEKNLLKETPEHCQRLKLTNPILGNNDLRKIKSLDQTNLKAVTLSLLFDKTQDKNGLKKALKNLFKEADKKILQGYSIIILSDKGVNKHGIAIPVLLASSGLHHHLIRKGTRTKVSIIVETGEARELHHFAVLLGFGTNAINPYLVFDITHFRIKNNLFNSDITYDTARANFLKATTKGLYKIISKMGISTIMSYCGAQIFEAVGLNQKVINKYFTGTPSRIGGIGLKVIAEESFLRHNAAFPKTPHSNSLLDEGGYYKWRQNGELHMWNPETIAALRFAVGTNNYQEFKKYSSLVNNPKNNYATIRSMLEFRVRKSIPIEEVEPAEEIVKRFATGAMSYGSISKEAHETIAIAMNKLGGISNTGEGGEDPGRYKIDGNGNLRRSGIKQIAQGRFGVTIEYLVNADQIQIKMAQGAKPGEGGHLPAHKVSEEIAKTRYTTPGVALISPPPHHDIYSIEDLSQLIYDLKNANPKADISVKLVSEIGIGTIAAGVSKGKADRLLISGYEGGTGASPLTSIKHAGLPLELGLAETQQVLVLNGLRRRIRIQADGQLKTGRDVVIAALLGADEFGFATSVLITLGCIMLRHCHLNTCTAGIATQDPELRKNFIGKPEHVITFFMFIAEEVREIMSQLGIRRFDQLIGHSELLQQVKDFDHWKAKYLNISNIIRRPDIPHLLPVYNTEKQKNQIRDILDFKLSELCRKAINKKQQVRFSMLINNTNRTVGTMLSSEIATKYGLEGLPDNTIHVDFEGSAGQSFGAFLSKGITFRLEGDANDYVGKGLSGGKIIIVPHEKSKLIPEENIIVGNVVLYGAISGEAYFSGIACERFCVRNSGAVAVVEGVGDHGCEYMTGGRVVILGGTGKNFAAGMSGGIAYVWDINNNFERLYNREMVELFKVDNETDEIELKTIIENHFHYTNSGVAKNILEHWNDERKRFIKVFPTNYRHVLEQSKNKEAAESVSI